VPAPRSAVQHPTTWLTLLQHQPGNLVTSICYGFCVSAADTFMLLIKASATVTVYRGHCRTHLPARVNSLFIKCMWIIKNNALVSSRTPATDCVTLYCTWRPSALTTGPQGQVNLQWLLQLKSQKRTKWLELQTVQVIQQVTTRSNLLHTCVRRCASWSTWQFLPFVLANSDRRRPLDTGTQVP